MSVQHLFKFQKEEDYKTAKRNHLLVPNISKIVETGETYINSAFIPKELAEAGDIVVYHEEEDGTKTVKYMKAQAYNKEDDYWKADAIVVVPYSHTGDGTVRVMGLNYASVETPNEGGNGEEIIFGAEISPEILKRYDSFVTFDAINGQTSEYTFGTRDCGTMPSDAIEGVLNPFDTETNYDNGTSFPNNILPSPYNNDGSKNEAYHSIGDFSEFTETPFTDMDGEDNTKNIVKNINENAIQEVLYAETIHNDDSITVGEEYLTYPAAIACVRYGSVLKPSSFDTAKSVEENLQTMPWYMPSMGEMGYYFSRKSKINYALEQIGKTLSEVNVPIASSTCKQQSVLPETEPVVPSTHEIPHQTVTENKILCYGIVNNGEVTTYSGNINKAYVIPFCKM